MNPKFSESELKASESISYKICTRVCIAEYPGLNVARGINITQCQKQ